MGKHLLPTVASVFLAAFTVPLAVQSSGATPRLAQTLIFAGVIALAIWRPR